MSELTKLENFMGFDLVPVMASEHGAQMDAVNAYVHWLMLILFIGWITFFIYSLVRFRASANPKASYHGVTSHKNTAVEVAVVLAEVVLLFGFSIPLWTNWSSEFPKEKDSVVVRVVAEQFAWNFHYAGPDGKFGKTVMEKLDVQSNPLGLDREGDPNAKDDVVTSTLHLPIGKPVITHISSKDVIHGFGVPAMRLKQDATPGLVIPIHFTPNRIGKYLIACSQLCGVGHAKMKGVVAVHSQDDFDQWLDSEVAKAQAEAEEGEAW